MEKRIIDVSKHQGIIDWSKVKNSIDGAIIRCGFGNDEIKQDDGQFKVNVESCIFNDIPFGVYLYSYAKTNDEAISEAKHLLRLVAPYKDKLTYPVYLDLEENGTQNGCVDRAKIFAEIITKAGYVYGTYANEFWWKNYIKDGLDNYTKWVAKYSANKPNVSNYDIWQYSSTWRIAGINGNVDVNIVYKDFSTFTTPQKKSTSIIAQEVIDGKWGNGNDRKIALLNAGYDYNEVQSKVNELVGNVTPPKKSIEEIAKEVIAGKWGNGVIRRANIENAGYNYKAVQMIVNKLLK